ncbi:MAG: GGDEF domain-containing protein [Woeseia sp.]
MTSAVSQILVAMTLNSAMLSIVFLLAWKTQGKKPYTLNWSLAFLAATVQWLVILSGDLFPSFETYWLTVNVLGMAVITLGLRGHCQRTDCQILPQNLWPYATLIYAAIVWFTVIEQHVGLRTALLPLAAALTLFLSAIMIMRHRRTPRPAERAAAVAITLFGLSQLVAAYAAVLQGAAGSAVYRDLYVNINVLSLPAGYTGVAVFVIFMLASDLSGQMKEIAVRDQLTGLFNRRGFGEQASLAFAMARRTDRPVSVIMTDIDRFKFINDEYGHAAGDKALCHFADVLRENRRAEDILSRMGGEEFALVLPGTGITECIRIAEDLCLRLERTPLEVEGELLVMTASFGVATISARDTCLTDVIVRADRALYRSKRAGRNRVDLESSQIMRCTDGSLKPIST